MPKNHLKTQNAPTTWPVKRKEKKFVTRPNPGAHRRELSMPINMAIRNLLGKARTNKEVKKILREQEVLVNGRRRRDDKYPVGLLDIISFPKPKEYYTMLINTNGKLFLKEIEKKDSEQKLSKITGKKLAKKGLFELKTLDGRTILVKKDTYKRGDSIVITIPKQEIKDTFKLEKGSPILLFRGKYTGQIANVEEVQDEFIKFKMDSQLVETPREYAIVMGKDKPIIKIK